MPRGFRAISAKLTDLDRLYKVVKEQKGRVDIVFANAGIGEFVALDAMTEAHFDKTFDVNVKGTLFTVQKALPLFNEGGSIILTGLDRHRQRHSRVRCLQCQQSRDPFLCAHVDA